MENVDFAGLPTEWSPFSRWGITHPITHVDVPIIIYTWVALAFLIIVVCVTRSFFHQKKSTGHYLLSSIVKGFMDLCSQSLGRFHYGHFSFVFSLFLFILFCNLMGQVPFIEEPTSNLNTTLALGIIGFIYTNIHAIKAQGIKAYLNEYLEPFFLMLPLNIVGKLAGVISISFRLFGNMFGGSLISNIYFSTVGSSYILAFLGFFSGINFCLALFFGLFEGLIQAFVFAMLSLTYLSIEVHTDTTHEIK